MMNIQHRFEYNKSIYEGIKALPIRISRKQRGNDIETMPLLFNHVQTVINKHKLPATINSNYADIPNANGKVLQELANLGVNFEQAEVNLNYIV